MPILKRKQESKVVSQKLNIDESLLKEITRYCKWSGLKDEGDFFIEAAEYVLSKDSEWKKHKKSKEKQEKDVIS